MGLLLRADGTELEVKPADGVKFSLDELYKLIGCDLIERVNISKKYDLVFDEEGKFKSPLIKNVKATELAHHQRIMPGDFSPSARWKISDGDCIVGNCMVCETFFIKDEDGGSDYWR